MDCTGVDDDSPPLARSPVDDDETVVDAVLRTVATTDGISATELPPLYDVVDPDALDALFDNSTAMHSVSFVYGSRTVVVKSDDTVELRPTESAE